MLWCNRMIGCKNCHKHFVQNTYHYYLLLVYSSVNYTASEVEHWIKHRSLGEQFINVKPTPLSTYAAKYLQKHCMYNTLNVVQLTMLVCFISPHCRRMTISLLRLYLHV